MSLIFVILIMVCLDVILFGIVCLGTYLFHVSRYLSVSFSGMKDFSDNFFKYIFGTFSSLTSSGIPIMWMFIHLILSQMSLNLLSFFKNLFFCCSVGWFPLVYLPDHLMHSSVSPSLLLIPFGMFYISVVFFNSDWLFFKDFPVPC